MKEIGDLKVKYGVPLLCVDIVSGLGGTPIHVDDWHVDFALGGSQKCLSAPANMSFLSVSEEVAQVRFPAYYTCFEDAIIHFLVFRLAKSVASVPEMVYLWRKNPKGLTATSQHHPAAVQSYWIIEQLLAQDAALGLPHDALYRCTLTLQLSAFCYATVSGLPPETQQAVFRLCCALYAKALPQEGALPRRARWGARALRQQDFGLWCRYGRRFQLL